MSAAQMGDPRYTDQALHLSLAQAVASSFACERGQMGYLIAKSAARRAKAAA